MDAKIGMCILAAGKGTRMKWDSPKALAPLLGKSLIDYSLACLEEFSQIEKCETFCGIVTGHLREQVESHVTKNHPTKKIHFAFQEVQSGTADALKSYFSKIPDAHKTEFTVVICADTPLIEASDLTFMFNEFKNHEKLFAVCATFYAQNPTGYGRIVRGKNGFHIIEEKDADLETKQIQEVNSGLYIFKTSFILDNLKNVSTNNKAGEFYLTDLFQDHFEVKPLQFASGQKFLGINTLTQLEEVGKLLKKRQVQKLTESGVLFLDPESVYLESDVQIGQGSIIHPNVYCYGKTIIGERCIIEPGVVMKNATLEKEVEILAHSYLEDAVIRTHATIGPMARIRPGSDVGEKSKIGNFVEIKKAKLDKGVKISHLSYVGDAFIGEETNIGCGFITCNYDGANKHITKIGKNSFIGSDCQAVAPIEIGDNAFVAAGTTITKNVPSDGFAIARAMISVKEGLAKKFIKKKS
ncbi:MAG: bifunctional UDP-N-acetylglucosamine diphosphorylase/glucosamine-1-phosphate N-acetyltransferase GlmU [Bacteriovoracaceae bacterium]